MTRVLVDGDELVVGRSDKRPRGTPKSGQDYNSAACWQSNGL